MRRWLFTAFFLLIGLRPLAAGEIGGMTLPCVDAALAFTVPGRLAALNVKEGDEVEAGALLAELDARVLDARIAQIAYEAEMDTPIRAADAEAAQRAADGEKLLAAQAKGAASDLEVQHARLEAEIAVFRREIAENEQELARLKLEEARAEREQYSLYSPVAGRVEKLAYEVGEAVQALEPAVRVVNVDPLWVEAPVPLAMLRALNWTEGGTVVILFPGDVKAEGTILFIASAADAASETAKVRVAVPNPERRRAGERVRLLAVDTVAAIREAP